MSTSDELVSIDGESTAMTLNSSMISASGVEQGDFSP